MTTGTTKLADELLPAVPRSQPAPRRPRKRRQRLHPATALVGVGLVAVTLVMGAAMVRLHQDLTRLQSQVAAQNHNVSCADVANLHLHVRNRIVRCTERGN